MELEDFMIAKQEAEKEIADAVNNAIENFRQRTNYSPCSVSVLLVGTIGTGWAMRVKVREVNLNV